MNHLTAKEEEEEEGKRRTLFVNKTENWFNSGVVSVWDDKWMLWMEKEVSGELVYSPLDT